MVYILYQCLTPLSCILSTPYKNISCGEEPYSIPEITAQWRLVYLLKLGSQVKKLCHQHVAQGNRNIPTRFSCDDQSVTVLLHRKGLHAIA